jgi:two-component system, LytTR family, response regulator
MNTKPFVELPTPLGSEFIDPEIIISIQAKDKSICICTENENEKLVRLSMGKAEKLFNHYYFVKCHRSHIVNILKIKERINKQNKIRLINNEWVPLSESYKENFEKTLKGFCNK